MWPMYRLILNQALGLAAAVTDLNGEGLLNSEGIRPARELCRLPEATEAGRAIQLGHKNLFARPDQIPFHFHGHTAIQEFHVDDHTVPGFLSN